MKAILSGLRIAVIAAATGAAVLLSDFAASTVSAGELAIYTAANAKRLKVTIAAFKKAYPDIKVSTIAESTGTMVRRAIAEKSNPQADVIFAINTFGLEELKAAGAFQPYTPKNSPVPEELRDPDGFWVAEYLGVYGMAVNTKLLKAAGLPMPKSWVDLIKPIYKGHIAIASPTKSGTGLVIFSTLVDVFGWNFLDNLHQNIFTYTSSGSAPARKAGGGEVTIGLSYDTAIKQQVDAGRSVVMVLPSVLPNVARGAGLLAGAPHPKEGKIFLDWMFSEEGAKVTSPFGGVHSIPGYGWLAKAGYDVTKLNMWKMRRPLDSNEFKRKWSARYQK